jgi:very-short-patch-repair endonuclease
VLHRVRTLARWETRAPGGLPLTSPARTALDLAATRPRAELEHVLQEMFVARLVSDRDLQRVVAAHPRHPGAAVLRTVLALAGPASGHTRSEAERAFSRLVTAAGLPAPRRNVWIEGELIDAVWDAQRLVVEIDGAGAHDHSLAFGRDRRRDAKLVAAGWRVIRFTRDQVCEEPILVAVRLAQALAAAA